MKHILGIDPGITTGLSLVEVADNDGETRRVSSVHRSMSFHAADLLVGLHDADLLDFLVRADAIAIEDTPVPTQGKMNRQLDVVIHYLVDAVLGSQIDPVVYVQPGQWKPIVGKIKRSTLFGEWRPDTRHEEDAARIALFVGQTILPKLEASK